jgi:hypothetical protein
VNVELIRHIFKENPQISSMTKIRPVGAQLFLRMDVLADRRDAANSRLSKFCERAYKRQ